MGLLEIQQKNSKNQQSNKRRKSIKLDDGSVVQTESLESIPSEHDTHEEMEALELINLPI